ncbi:MAG TPA: hypothetical protein VJ787_04855, partial [Thermoleophilia bacterium]|nr:hypothetical protein [Thermoleophilia bacterium]
TSATGTFVLAAGLGGVLATGDVCVLRKFVEASGIAAALEEAYIERPMGRVNFAFGDGLRGPRSGSFSFATHVYPSGSLAAAGSKANASVLSGLFAACGYVETINTSCTVGVGSTTGAVKIATGSWENLSVGAMVVWNGNPAWITSLADGAAAEDTVNITPALPLAPAASDVLYATRMYAKSTSAEVYGCGFEWEVDGVRHTVTGCMGNVALQDGDPLTMAWQFQVDQHVVDLEPAPYNAGAAYTTAQPVLAADRVAWVDTTKTSIAGFTASLNTTFAPKNIQGADGVNGRSAFQLTGIAAGCTWRELLNSATTSLPQLLRWLARTAVDLKVAFDSHGRTVGLRVPVARHRERPNVTDDGGLAATPNVMQAQDAGTATDGASAVQKVPDFSIHIA